MKKKAEQGRDLVRRVVRASPGLVAIVYELRAGGEAAAVTLDESELIERLRAEFAAEEVSSGRGAAMPGQPDMAQMVKQVQQVQAEMAKAQEQLKNEVVEASAGGGMVTVKVSGDLELEELRIDPEAVDPDDVELLQDMVQAAVNEGFRAAQELAAQQDGRRHRRPGRRPRQFGHSLAPASSACRPDPASDSPGCSPRPSMV